MANKRFTPEEVLETVKNLIQAKGGTATHNDVLEGLEQAGMGSQAVLLMTFANVGSITASVEAQPTGSPILVYSV